MTHPRFIAPALIAALALTACGGNSDADQPAALEDWEKSGLRADAAGHAANAWHMCLDGTPLSGPDLSWGEIADKLVDLHARLPDDPEIRKSIRSTADAMRQCGDSSQADRLNRATDA